MKPASPFLSVALALAAFPLFTACGSSTTLGPGGTDAGATDGAALVDPGPPDASADTTVAAFCADFDTYVGRCAVPAACRDTIRMQCPAGIGAFFGAAYRSAVHACLGEVSCDGPGASGNPCVSAKLEALPATAAQQKLATDFCAACAQGAAVTTSAQGIACAGHPPAATGPTLATEVLSLGDDAAAAAAPCVAKAKAAAASPSDYAGCEKAFLACNAALAPDPSSSCK